MEPNLFLEFAESPVADSNSGPAALRSAVSRAYYATFHEASSVQRLMGGRSVVSHEVIEDRFQTSTDLEVRRIGLRFMNLRTSRNSADYKLTGVGSTKFEDLESVRGMVGEARALIADVRSLRSGPLRAAAQQAVRDDDKRRFG